MSDRLRKRLRFALVLTAAVAAGSPAAAQRIQLVLRPRVGDTISMRLEQQTEVSGKRETSKVPSSTPAAPPAAAMISTTVTYSRAVVESAVAAFTTIEAITDSVFMSNTDAQGKSAPATTQRPRQQRVRLTVAPDGSIGMPKDGSAPSQGMSRTASLIPATFPAKAVKVGDSWTREAPLPAGTSQLGTGIVGKVKATFRLDSVTHGGDVAYVSMHGELLPDSKAKGMDGVPIVEDGTVNGFMVVDHVRGWLTESQFAIVAHSVLRPSFGVVSQPMHFEIRLTQKLQTETKR